MAFASRSLRNVFFCTATAAVLSACGTSTPSQPVTSYEEETETPAVIDVSTRFYKSIFSEIRPQDTSNLTCFTVTSTYMGSEGHADIDCIEGQSVSAPAGQTARITFQGEIGKSRLFTVSPVTRPDVECRVTTSGFIGSEGGGHLKCQRKPSNAASQPAFSMVVKAAGV